MRDWISIAEDLPKLDWAYEEVEVSELIKFKTEYGIEFAGTLQKLHDDGFEYLMWCSMFKDKVEDVHEYLGGKIGKVTHWMPLPEQPQEQK